MAYNAELANRVRNFLISNTTAPIQEKRMFGGLAFLVDDKMCVNVSGDELMCRYDPVQKSSVEHRLGYLPMIMRGKEMEGYCRVSGEGFEGHGNLKFWLNLCLAFNAEAKSSKK